MYPRQRHKEVRVTSSVFVRLPTTDGRVSQQYRFGGHCDSRGSRGKRGDYGERGPCYGKPRYRCVDPCRAYRYRRIAGDPWVCFRLKYNRNTYIYAVTHVDNTPYCPGARVGEELTRPRTDEIVFLDDGKTIRLGS